MVLSIIVPVYNREKYIKQCLTSISKIESTDFECIVVNDGSKDNSERICEDFVKKDNRFHLISTENKGVACARNLGIKLAKGKYVTFVDSDDVVLPVDLAFLKGEMLYSLNMLKMNEKRTTKVKFRDSSLDKNFLCYPVYMNSVCNKFFLKQIIDGYSISFETTTMFEDFFFVVNFLAHTNLEITYVDRDYYIYRDNSVSLTHKKMSKEMLQSYCSTYKKVCRTISDCGFAHEFRNLMSFHRLNCAIPYLVNVDFYDFANFRRMTKRGDIWHYDYRADLFVVTVFAQMNLRMFCNCFIKLKKLLKMRNELMV